MATLYAKSGPLAGTRTRLVAELVIGRENADISIDDPDLSRRHVAVRVMGRGVEVEDLGSTNGTFVDDQRIHEPVRVGGGARIRLGSTVFELEGVLPVRKPAKTTIASPAATRIRRVPQATRPSRIPGYEPGGATSATKPGATPAGGVAEPG